LEIYSINLQLDFNSGICYTGDRNMLKVQLKDNCWLCLGLKQDCPTCNGSGEVITWITLEELVDHIDEIQRHREQREQFLAPTDSSTSFNIENLEIPPNLNI